MADSKMHVSRDPTFERFPGATVGEDGRGTNVTVLSMLARLGVDPWDEASDLAAMPQDPARQRPEALMARFKEAPPSFRTGAGSSRGFWPVCRGRQSPQERHRMAHSPDLRRRHEARRSTGSSRWCCFWAGSPFCHKATEMRSHLKKSSACDNACLQRRLT